MAALRGIALPPRTYSPPSSQRAEVEHRSIDDVLADVVRRYLDDQSWQELFAYGAERAKSLELQEADVDRLIAELRAGHHRQ